VSGAPEGPGGRGRALLARRRRAGAAGEIEIHEKRGRSRRYAIDRLGESSQLSVEEGWAARGGDAERSWFLAGSGLLPGQLEAPPATPAPLRLPEAFGSGDARAASPELDTPLASEGEGRALLAGIARELERELPGAELVAARLDDGASESALVSSRGVDAAWRSRTATLRITARRGELRVDVELVARSATGLKPLGVARRIADRLAALDRRDAERLGEAPLLLASPVAARLLEAFAPRLVGADAPEARRAAEGGEPPAAAGVTIVDDGGRRDGLLAAPVDGEGVPTRETVLVEAGRFARPLLAWWESPDPTAAPGCSLRPGWRDLPRRGPTQLWIEPEPRVAVADLVGEAGAFLIAPEGLAAVDAESGLFELAVAGYRLEGGRAAAPLGPGRLRGSLATWLSRVRAVARDLGFVPGGALYGAPSLLVDGLEWAPDEARGGR